MRRLKILRGVEEIEAMKDSSHGFADITDVRFETDTGELNLISDAVKQGELVEELLPTVRV